MLDREHREGIHQTKRQHRVKEQLVQFLSVARFGHTDVEITQMTVHGQRQEHHVKQPTLDGRKVESVQTGTHVSDVRGADDAVPREGSTDRGEGLHGLCIEHLHHLGRFFVDAFHEQEKMFG